MLRGVTQWFPVHSAFVYNEGTRCNANTASYSSTPRVRRPVRSIHVLHSGRRFCCVFPPQPRPLMFRALPGDTHLKAVKQLQDWDRNWKCCNCRNTQQPAYWMCRLGCRPDCQVRCQAGARITSLQYRLWVLRIWDTPGSNSVASPRPLGQSCCNNVSC
jgi:hypothetical protein